MSAEIEQRDRALRKANRIRMLRAQLKRDVRTGARSPAALLRDPPDYAAGMRVADLLIAIPQIGKRTADEILRRYRISSGATMDELRERERDALAYELRKRVRYI